jgi:hypothetical protein
MQMFTGTCKWLPEAVLRSFTQASVLLHHYKLLVDALPPGKHFMTAYELGFPKPDSVRTLKRLIRATVRSDSHAKKNKKKAPSVQHVSCKLLFASNNYFIK